MESDRNELLQGTRLFRLVRCLCACALCWRYAPIGLAWFWASVSIGLSEGCVVDEAARC